MDSEIGRVVRVSGLVILGAIFGLLVSNAPASAAYLGFKVITPFDIGMNNFTYLNQSPVIADFNDNTDLVMYAAGQPSTNNRMHIRAIYLDDPNSPDSYGCAVVKAIHDNKWVNCTIYGGCKSTGLCGGDIRPQWAYLVFNRKAVNWPYFHEQTRFFDRFVLTHETGHAIGLAHAGLFMECPSGTVMNSYECLNILTQPEHLEADDICDINDLYP